MRSIDKSAQIVRRAVEMTRREKIDPVVAPAEFAREICDRHHFNHADAGPRQLAQLAGGGRPGSLGRECADVHFVNDLALQIHARPFLIAPAEIPIIDHAGRAMWSAGLIAGRRIWVEIPALIQPKAVARAGSDFGFTGKITISLRDQWLKNPLRSRIHILLENKI